MGLQFLIQWYQVTDTEFIVKLSVSRLVFSSTVVSADIQFLVEWYQLTDMPFTVEFQLTDVQPVVERYHLGNLQLLLEWCQLTDM
jgi:hypothetical protein